MSSGGCPGPGAYVTVALVGLAALALPGCRKPSVPPPPLVQAPAVAPVPTGRLQGDTYVDGTWPLIVPVPPGWTAEIGEDGSVERVVLADPDGDVRVTIAATPGDTLAPRPLPGCAWTFQDVGRYRAVKVRDAVLAATCTPDEPDAPRIIAYVVAQEGVLFHVEGRVPQGRLRAGKADLDVVVGAMRFR